MRHAVCFWRVMPLPYPHRATFLASTLVVPLKDAVRAAEGVELGDVVTVRLTITLER